MPINIRTTNSKPFIFSDFMLNSVMIGKTNVYKWQLIFTVHSKTTEDGHPIRWTFIENSWLSWWVILSENYLYKTDNSVGGTFWSVPWDVHPERFSCIDKSCSKVQVISLSFHFFFIKVSGNTFTLDYVLSISLLMALFNWNF